MIEFIELYITSLVLALATVATGCIGVLCIAITKRKIKEIE